MKDKVRLLLRFLLVTAEQQEFEAEIVSYIICERYGIENQSWKYLSKWFDNDTDIPNISTERIFKASEEIFKMIEGKSIKNSFMYKSNKEFQSAAKSCCSAVKYLKVHQSLSTGGIK